MSSGLTSCGNLFACFKLLRSSFRNEKIIFVDSIFLNKDAKVYFEYLSIDLLSQYFSNVLTHENGLLAV